MTLFEAIEQLKDLKINQESFIDGKDPDPDNPFVKDMAAIDRVLKCLNDLEAIKKDIKTLKYNVCNTKIDDEIWGMNYVTGYCAAMTSVEQALEALNG